MKANYASRISGMEKTAAVVTQLFNSYGDSSLILFSGGEPAEEYLPVDASREIAADVLQGQYGTEILSYGSVLGSKALREVVVEYFLKPYGIKASIDNVLIITGGMEAISLSCQVFIEKGDVVLVESPTFFHAMATFDMVEANCVGVDVDEYGMLPDDLEAKIQKYHPKMIYTIPTFQNPTGRTMPADRRQRVAEIAAKYDTILLEDDPYREIRYSGTDVPPIKSFDVAGNVIMGGSFSKIFAPGFRLGFVVASDEIMSKLQNVKVSTNSHTALLPQAIVAEYFNRGYYAAHRKELCDVHRVRRDVCMDALARYFPKEAKYTIPDGGLFVWIELPDHINTKELRDEAASRPDIKVTFTPGETFFTKDTAKKNCMRLSFSNLQPEAIEIGIQRLAKLIKEKL